MSPTTVSIGEKHARSEAPESLEDGAKRLQEGVSEASHGGGAVTQRQGREGGWKTCQKKATQTGL